MADWISRESGVKGLKLTSGICCFLPSVKDFRGDSTFLKRATLLLEDPGAELLALDSKLCKKGLKINE